MKYSTFLQTCITILSMCHYVRFLQIRSQIFLKHLDCLDIIGLMFYVCVTTYVVLNDHTFISLPLYGTTNSQCCNCEHCWVTPLAYLHGSIHVPQGKCSGAKITNEPLMGYSMQTQACECKCLQLCMINFNLLLLAVNWVILCLYSVTGFTQAFLHFIIVNHSSLTFIVNE